MELKKTAAIALIAAFAATPALAQDKGGNNECPVGLVSGLALDDEFGPGTQELTRCIKRRHNVKVVIQVNQKCADTACTRAYALGNISNILDDYEITHGMRPGKDFEVVAVVHSGGGDLLLQNGYQFNDTVKGTVTIANQFQGAVQDLMDRGVRFLFCQNTTRGFMSSGKLPSWQQGEGSATDAVIPGVEYTTAGVSAIADFQKLGYEYIQP